MLKKLIVLFSVIVFFNAIHALAVSPPELVYRVDKRPPGDIDKQFKNGAFFHGLTPWRTGVQANMNVVDHVSGRSCTAQGAVKNSGFISTTSDKAFAMAYLKSIRRTLTEGQTVTLYTIRATSIFYDSYRTLRHLHDHRIMSVSANEFILAAVESEWISAGPIPPNLIISAEIYSADGSHQPVTNIYYVPILDEQVTGNSQPYIQLQALSLRSRWRVWIQDRIMPIVSSCFNPNPEPEHVRASSGQNMKVHELSSYFLISVLN